MKFREFLVVAMVAVGTTIIIFDTLSGASKIGAGSSPSVRRPPSAQLSALAMTNLTPVEPGVSLAGSPQGIDHTARNKATTKRTKHKNVAPEKSGARLSKAQLRVEVKKALPKLSTKEVDAAVWIIWKESTGRLYARNPRSSSSGLNGFLSGTWRTVTSRSGIRHGYDPRTQILAMKHYAYPRYGSFSAAKAHHVRKGWY